MNILVFGDSTVYGKGDTMGGWVQRLRSSVDTEFYKVSPDGYYAGAIVALPANGGTSVDLLNRFETDLKPRAVAGVSIIICVGLNDSSWNNAEKRNRVEISVTQESLSKIIEISKKYTSDITVLGLLPVDESRADPLPWGRGYSYLNHQIARYNDVIKDVSTKSDVNFIDLLGETNNQKYIDTMIRDGVHPNNEGHELIYKIVRKELEKQGVIE